MSRAQIHLANVETMLKGVIGFGVNILGIVTSRLDEVEAWLRVTSLLIGIAVGIVTIWSIVFRRKRP